MEFEYMPILDFWFRELVPSQWFMGDVKLDELVRQRFGALHEEVRKDMRDGWTASPRGRLALILVLDQFSRHIFRGMAEAFAGDRKAQQLSRDGIDAGMDRSLTFDERHFFYMPLMHAEDKALQSLSVAKFTDLRDEAERVLNYAKGHRATVDRFGRFPQRNAALGRLSTPQEDAFLESEKNEFS
jgi:uncharacterized protein (DUF924 family)